MYLVLLSLSLITCVYGQCHGDWHYHGGSCYALGERQFSWTDAEEACDAYDAKLAEIESSDENEFLKSMARSKGGSAYWIGGTDIFHEGVFTWASSGENIYDFTDWYTGRPNDNGGQDCMILWGGFDYQWNDRGCEETHFFICEAGQQVIIG